MHRPDVIEFLAQHHWVAATRELGGLGMSPDAVKRARCRGWLLSPARGVVVLAGVELTFEGRARLGQLAAGAEAFVSGPSAGALYGLRGMPTRRIEVTTWVSRSRLSLPPDVTLVRTLWGHDPDAVVVRPDGLRVASPMRMLFGLAAQFNEYRFERAAEDAWHRQLLTPEQAADYLRTFRASGRTGVARMEKWLDKARLRQRPSQSGLELDFVHLIERAGLPDPQRQYPLCLSSGELIHLDLAWPDVMLAVEPGHSWWHGGDLGQRRDQQRDRACGEVGWQVLRYDEEARRRPSAVVGELVAIYRRRLMMVRRGL